MTGDVITGTGDSLPADVESMRTQMGTDNPSGKGDVRATKHGKLSGSSFDRYAKEHPDSVDKIGEHEGRNKWFLYMPSFLMRFASPSK
jgi:hypothetical protein